MNNKNKYYEIITSDNRRPDYPEDNTVILQAKNMKDAVGKFHTLMAEGRLKVRSDIKVCRHIQYFFETN